MIIVGCGAALGAIARYLITYWWKYFRIDWPFATLIINLSGAFFLGLLMQKLGGNSFSGLFWQTGVLGGYTTFSTLNTELIAMYNDHQWLKFTSYLFLTYLGGLGAAWLGLII
ncbi:CrcB family protein [Lactobacillaceae bacterium 24-114]